MSRYLFSMSIEKNILRILEEINKSQKFMVNSIGLNESTTLTSPLNRKLTVTSGFGPRWGTQHTGVDLVANAENVRSPANGIVTYTASDEGPCGGTIKIKHADGYTTGYCHMMKINVRAGQLVKQGDVIGISGGGLNDPGKGRTQGRHLHFTLRKDDVLVDPMKFLGKDGVILTSDSDFTSSKVVGSSQSDKNTLNVFPSSVDNLSSLSSPENKLRSVIDDLYNDREEFEYGGFKKKIKENIIRIKKML